MKGSRRARTKDGTIALPIWLESLVCIELVYLRISPVYWGFGIPRGDGSPVVTVPGFMGSDEYLAELRGWLGRIGYTPYDSGITLNAECPNLLIRRHLTETVARAYADTGRKVHLIGHSLGGAMAVACASQMSGRIASLITLGAPLSGLTAHPTIMRTAAQVRAQILQRHGDFVLPECYTGACTCDFLNSLMGKFPKSVRRTAIYTKTDGILDWHVCTTGDPAIDVEVSATHLGLVFSPLAYAAMARRLAEQ